MTAAPGPGEPVERRTAAELSTRELGRTVQTPGHRGVLLGAWTDDDGRRAVCTTTGIAHYQPAAPFLVWGPR